MYIISKNFVVCSGDVFPHTTADMMICHWTLVVGFWWFCRWIRGHHEE